MLTDIDALQSKLGNRGRALNRKPVVFLKVGEPEAELVDRGRSNRVVVRDKKAAVLIVRGYVWQKLVGEESAAALLGGHIFPAKTRIKLLLGRNILIESQVPAIGVCGNWRKGLVVVRRTNHIQIGIGQRIVAQQRLRRAIDATLAGAGGNDIVRVRLAGKRICNRSAPIGRR